MNKQIETIVNEYSSEKLDRRGFLTRMIALTGTYAAAHLLLEQTGLAQTVVSDKESKKRTLIQAPSNTKTAMSIFPVT